MKSALGIDAELRHGTPGQFDVIADGEVIASRDPGVITRLLGGGWPDPDAVVAALREKMG